MRSQSIERYTCMQVLSSESQEQPEKLSDHSRKGPESGSKERGGSRGPSGPRDLPRAPCPCRPTALLAGSCRDALARPRARSPVRSTCRCRESAPGGQGRLQSPPSAATGDLRPPLGGCRHVIPPPSTWPRPRAPPPAKRSTH